MKQPPAMPDIANRVPVKCQEENYQESRGNQATDEGEPRCFDQRVFSKFGNTIYATFYIEDIVTV